MEVVNKTGIFERSCFQSRATENAHGWPDLILDMGKVKGFSVRNATLTFWAFYHVPSSETSGRCNMLLFGANL